MTQLNLFLLSLLYGHGDLYGYRDNVSILEYLHCGLNKISVPVFESEGLFELCKIFSTTHTRTDQASWQDCNSDDAAELLSHYHDMQNNLDIGTVANPCWHFRFEHHP